MHGQKIMLLHYKLPPIYSLQIIPPSALICLTLWHLHKINKIGNVTYSVTLRRFRLYIFAVENNKGYIFWVCL